MNAAEFSNHLRELGRKQARRLLADPEPPTGFQDDLAPMVKDRLELGRRALIQIPDFEGWRAFKHDEFRSFPNPDGDD